MAAQLPIGRGSSGVFSGSTVIASGDTERQALYRELADRIRKAGADDPINITRQIITEGLGVPTRHAPWFARAQKLALAALQSAQVQIQERLRKLRSR